MACTRPIKGYRGPGGTVTFSARTGYYDQHLEIPCGQCLSCRLERARGWAIRCQHEASLHRHADGSSRNAFLTLTYDDGHLPEDLSLDVNHWKLFAKRLRHAVGPFRFLHVGEYGDINKRPHYHALLFGQDLTTCRKCKGCKKGKECEKSRVLGGTSTSGNPWFLSPILTEIWPHGFHQLGHLTTETVNYVCRYATKKLTGPARERETARRCFVTGREWNVRPPYATQSRRPGIGSKWFAAFHTDLFPADFAIERGKKAKVPKYYYEQLKQTNPEMAEAVKHLRHKSAARRAEDNTPERRQVREEVVEARFAMRKTGQLDEGAPMPTRSVQVDATEKKKTNNKKEKKKGAGVALDCSPGLGGTPP